MVDSSDNKNAGNKNANDKLDTKIPDKVSTSIFESETVVSPIFDQTTANVANASNVTNGKAAVKLAPPRSQAVRDSAAVEVEDALPLEASLNITYSKEPLTKKILETISLALSELNILIESFYFKILKLNLKNIVVGIFCLIVMLFALQFLRHEKNKKLISSDTDVTTAKIVNSVTSESELVFNSKKDFLSSFETNALRARELAIGR